MQGSPFHRSAGNMHRLQIGYRRDGTCPPYLINHIDQGRLHLFGLKLISNGPTGRFCRISQQMLHPDIIDFDHNPIDRNRQTRPFFIPFCDKGPNFFKRIGQVNIRGHMEAPFFSFHQVSVMGFRRSHFAGNIVKKTIQMPFRYQRRIL